MNDEKLQELDEKGLIPRCPLCDEKMSVFLCEGYYESFYCWVCFCDGEDLEKLFKLTGSHVNKGSYTP